MLKYIVKRIMIMIPLLIVLSVVCFVIIQLPPGDFLTTYINSLASSNAKLSEENINVIKAQFGLNDPPVIQYFKWAWGFLCGNLGFSLAFQRNVNVLIEERLGYTIFLSFSSLILIWLIGFPLGFYSVTHQHNPIDNVARSISFFGMSVPEFMLALVLMWLFYQVTGKFGGGMFSEGYRDQPMSWGKLIDFFKHMWLPYLIIATTGTAGIFKVFRANLIDEINKPYMKTAIAKGLSYKRALLKYPVRIALIPFVATVGWSLPGLISGQTIIAIVMDLPTVAPLLNAALTSQDMYLGSSIVMILSCLTMAGTLLSDIILALVDPRVRNSL